VQRICLAGLVAIDLPDHDARLCDGGTVPWDGDTYGAFDDLLGVLASVERMDEGVGDEAPAGSVTFLPPSGVANVDLMDPAFQDARVRTYVAEIDPDTGEVVGDPDQQDDWRIDVPRLAVGLGKRALTYDCVPTLERIFETERGNTLSPNYHKSIFPGELGFDHASGVSFTFAFGAVSPPRGTVTSGVGFGGGSGSVGDMQ
jgi:hypothetical protein